MPYSSLHENLRQTINDNPEYGRFQTDEQAFIKERRTVIKSWLNLNGTIGLEIAPNWLPLVSKEEANIYYCDRISYKKLIKREKNNPDRIKFGLSIEPIDFIIKDGKQLKHAVNKKFDYILSSHVMEHVPDFLGYLQQQREILKDDGIIALVLPDINRMGEHYRPPTTAAQLIGAYLTKSKKPTPGQVYESLRHMLDIKENENFIGTKYTDFKPFYTNEQQIQFAKIALKKYLDVHCWAFNPDSFQNVVNELREVDAFDYDLVDIKSGLIAKEFYVKLKPNKPLSANKNALDRNINLITKIFKRIKKFRES